MKILNKYIIKSFLGPFALTFAISVFVFIMIFVFKYIDDIVGKGLDVSVIAQLFFYYSLTTIPMALPLAILLASLMTFGNLGESYELAAIKSIGRSLQQIMMPLVFFIIGVCIFAFYFSNNILPYTNLKMGSLLFDVRESKPAFSIKEGIFYNGIDGYSMRVGKKHPDGQTVEDVLIYDHTSGRGNNKSILAESGIMQMSSDKNYLVITLRNGSSYEEVLDNHSPYKPHPLLRGQFNEQVVYLDLSGFKLTRTDEELFKNNYQMLNLKQLQTAVDSLKHYEARRKKDLEQQISQLYHINNLEKIEASSALKKDTTFFDQFNKSDKQRILEMATNTVRSLKSITEYSLEELNANEKIITRHQVEWHKKFTLPFACFVLFFIGAPLGAIIRKGGLGMPVVISVIFFILFHVISITGEKFTKEGVLPAYQGMWMAALVLLPIGIFLTLKATADSSLFDTDAYLKPLRKLFQKKQTA